MVAVAPELEAFGRPQGRSHCLMEHGARCRVQYTASSNSGLRRESLSSPQVHFGQPQAQAAAGPLAGVFRHSSGMALGAHSTTGLRDSE